VATPPIPLRIERDKKYMTRTNGVVTVVYTDMRDQHGNRCYLVVSEDRHLYASLSAADILREHREPREWRICPRHQAAVSWEPGTFADVPAQCQTSCIPFVRVREVIE
jgi:hypothetical protein